MPLCRCCSHPDRMALDLALVLGASQRVVARRFRVTQTSVYRHANQHIAETIAASKELTAMLNAENLCDQLSTWHRRMEEQYRKADAAGNFNAVIGIARTGIAAIDS
jgi:hypothetical protein